MTVAAKPVNCKQEPGVFVTIINRTSVKAKLKARRSESIHFHWSFFLRRNQ